MYPSTFHAAVALLMGVFTTALADGQPAVSPIVIRAIAEVESRRVEHGREVAKLLPADRVGSGDWIVYTLEVRNTASTAVPPPMVTYPVPEHMSPRSQTAAQGATEVLGAVDGGIAH